MTYFIFAGDMLVMAFMTIVVVWVSFRSSARQIEEAASISLNAERDPDA